MILIILAVALILRMISINQSLWLDEAINVNNAKILDFKSLVLNYSLGDFHPPLYHVVLKSWMLMFGTSEISVRLPSVIFGIVTVYVTYLIGKKLFAEKLSLFEEKTALIAAALMATAPLHIYYSQEARMYSLAAMLASLSVYFFTSIIKKDALVYWIGFIVSTALMLYSDYMPYLLIPLFVIYLFLNRKNISKHTTFAFIPAFVVVAILISPWLVVFQKQLNVGLSVAAASPAWAQVVGTPDLKNLLITFVKFTIGRISNDNNLIYALLFSPVAAYVALLLVMSFFRMSAKRSILWYWFLGSVGFGYSLAYIVPIFAYFRFIFVLPAFYLILASGINTINWTPLVRTFLVVALAINLISTTIYFTNPKFQRENWRDAVSYIKQNYREKSIVLFESNYTTGPFDYYNRDNKIAGAGALDSFNPDPAKVKVRVSELTQDIDRVFLFQYLSEITDPKGLVFEELSRFNFNNTLTKDFAGVGFIYEFKR